MGDGPVICVLEDEPRRVGEMRRVLSEQLPGCEVRVFDSAPDTVEWLSSHLGRCALISLDHDLGPAEKEGKGAVDPGTGRDVADFLAGREPTCPIIVHTSNSPAGMGMQMALEEGGWKVVRVYPYGDFEWIAAAWISEAVKCFGD